MVRKAANAALYMFFLLGCVVLPVEWYTRNFIIARDFYCFQVTPDRFPFFSLKETFDAPGITVRNHRRELLPRGNRARRIAFVGDSNTFAVGAEDADTYVEQVQKGQDKLDAYNYGVPGYGLKEIESVVHTITEKDRFDFVFYNWNFNDVLVAMSGTLPLLTRPENRLRAIEDYQGELGKWKLWTKDHWKGFAFFVGPPLGRFLARHEDSPPREITSKPALDPAPDCLAKMLQSDGPAGTSLQSAPSYNRIYSDRTLLREVRAGLRNLRERVETKGGKLVVFPHYDYLLFTSPDQIAPGQLLRILQEEKISYLDPYPLYAAHYKECGFFKDPGHLGKEGNHLMGQALLAYLRGAGSLP